jgi:HK97 family phage portal protein
MSLLNFFGLSPGPTNDFWYGPAPGQRTAAGVPVDQAVAMTYSACWASTMLLSTTGGMIPLKLYQYLDGGGSEPAVDLDRYYLVHDQFNPDMTNMMFRSSRFQFQINWGNTFAEIEMDGANRVKHIWPIHSSRIPKDNLKRGADGKMYYLVNNDDGSKTPLADWEVLHIPSPISDDGIWGRGVVEQARLSIGFGIATENQGASYFGNSARPKIVLSGMKFRDKSDREDFRRQWDEVHGGPENANKVGILPPDVKLESLNFSAEDSQFLETRQHNIEEIARWYGVPPHLIGHLLRSTYNNIEHQSLEFVKYGLMRWLVPWEQELNRKLLSADERRTLYFRHVVDGLERGDLQTRTNALKEQFFNGKITLDEWRALDEQNPIGGEAGKTHFVQQAMIPVDLALKGPQPTQTAGKPPEDKPEPKEDMSAKSLELLSSLNDRLAAVETAKDSAIAAATLEVVEHIVNGLLDREAKHALAASKDPSNFLKWLNGFYDDQEDRLPSILAKPVGAYLLASGKGGIAEQMAKEAARKHIHAGREALLAAASVPADQFPKSVESTVANWDRKEILSYLGACNGHV